MTAEPDEYQRDYEALPGMKEALETLKPEYWASKQPAVAPFPPPPPPPPPAKSKFMDKIMANPLVTKLRELKRKVDEMVFPIELALNKTMDNPLLLASALPLVQNMRMNSAMADLATIPEGQDLLDAIKPGLSVKLNADPRFNGGVNKAMISFENGVFDLLPMGIEVDAYASRGVIVGILAHELQHQRQLDARTRTAHGDKIPSPIEEVWYDRFIEADASATACDVAWKLKEAGKPAAWKAQGGFYPGGAQAYAEQATKDPASIYDGRAKRAAFDAWFTERGITQTYNKQGVANTLNEYGMETLAQHGKPLESIKISDIEKLGETPSSVNYLKIPGGRPLDDPYYRKPDWNKDEAMRLSTLHDKYDELKKSGAVRPDVSGEKGQDLPGKAVTAGVSLARPATYKAQAGIRL